MDETMDETTHDGADESDETKRFPFSPSHILNTAVSLSLSTRPPEARLVSGVLENPVVQAVINDPGPDRGAFRNALHRATRHPNGLPVMRALLDAGCDPNVRQGAGSCDTPLIMCIDEAVPATHLSFLLNAGADPNVTNGAGDAPLHRVVLRLVGSDPQDRSGLVFVTQLLDAGARWDLPNALGDTAWTLAFRAGLIKVLALFQQRDAQTLCEALDSQVARTEAHRSRTRL